MSKHYRDHDHSAEDMFLTYADDPTPENAHAAELAIALLQRRYDHVLRRLDGSGAAPEVPAHRHNAWDDPDSCLEAVLHKLAGAQLADRAETLAHGLEALRALKHPAGPGPSVGPAVLRGGGVGLLGLATLRGGAR